MMLDLSVPCSSSSPSFEYLPVITLVQLCGVYRLDDEACASTTYILHVVWSIPELAHTANLWALT